MNNHLCTNPWKLIHQYIFIRIQRRNIPFGTVWLNIAWPQPSKKIKLKVTAESNYLYAILSHHNLSPVVLCTWTIMWRHKFTWRKERTNFQREQKRGLYDPITFIYVYGIHKIIRLGQVKCWVTQAGEYYGTCLENNSVVSVWVWYNSKQTIVLSDNF